MSEMEYDFSGSQGAQVAKESNKGGDFAREVEYFGLDASDTGIAQGKNQMIVRFVTDAVRRSDAPMTKYNLAWITVGQHYSPTKPRPEYAREGANWPAKVGAGCRKDRVFAKKFNGTCFLCDRGEKASNRTWALAVEREQVLNDQGQVLGYRDKTREVFDTDEQGNLIVESQDGDKKTYRKKTVPAFVVINQGWKNFFGPLNAASSYFNSLLDADWVVTRSGTGNNDTTYTFIRVGEQNLPEGNPFGLPAGTKYDLAIPGLMEKVYPGLPDLRKIIADRVSDDYFGRFFVPGWMPKDFDPNKQQGQQQASAPAVSNDANSLYGGGTPANAAAPQVPQNAPAEEPSSSALSALQARVMGGAAQGS